MIEPTHPGVTVSRVGERSVTYVAVAWGANQIPPSFRSFKALYLAGPFAIIRDRSKYQVIHVPTGRVTAWPSRLMVGKKIISQLQPITNWERGREALKGEPGLEERVKLIRNACEAAVTRKVRTAR